MLLIYADKEEAKSKILYEQLIKETNLEVVWLSQELLINTGYFAANNKTGEIISYLEISDKCKISVNDIKICYLSHPLYILNEWIPYKNDYDKMYAQQEWSASFNSMFLTQNHIKFVNSIVPKFDMNSELEQLLILQKFGIDTIDMILTNNSKEALEFFNKNNREVLFKSVQCGYEFMSHMQIEDLGRLDKLYLSPALFQKSSPGKEINVCLIGNNTIAVKVFYENETAIYESVQIPDSLKEKLMKVSEYLNCPWLMCNFVLNDIDNNYYAYLLNVYPNFDIVYDIYGDVFVNVLKQYLVEEYNK